MGRYCFKRPMRAARGLDAGTQGLEDSAILTPQRTDPDKRHGASYRELFQDASSASSQLRRVPYSSPSRVNCGRS